MKRKSKNVTRGFTLLELLTVVAVISILAMLTLPIYFEYTVRTKVAEGLYILAELKNAVTETYQSNGAFPTDNSEAGLAEPTEYSTDYVSQVAVGANGVITVTFSLPTLAGANQLSFEPIDTGGGIDWRCRPADSSAIEEKYVPPECRN